MAATNEPDRRQFLKWTGLGAMGLALRATGLVFADERIGGEPFSLIALPDTHVHDDKSEQRLRAHLEWVLKDREELNVLFVGHEGDMVHTNTPEDWKRVRDCYRLIDGKVPYGVCVGNHDIKYKGPLRSPVCQYFKPEDYRKEPWWGGEMKGQNCFYYKVESGGQKYLLLSLSFGPDDDMLSWADRIVEKHRDHLVILFTHSYVHDDGTLSGPKDKKNAGHYGLNADGNRRNCGEFIWQKHVRKHPNYFMVLSGHNQGPAARLEGRGEKGNKVHQMMANYQYVARCEYLRILRFDPARKQAAVATYSPIRKKYWKDEANEFTLRL